MHKLIVFPLLTFFFFGCKAQSEDNHIQTNWQRIASGVWYCETDAPIKSDINDSKLTLVKIAADSVDFEMLMGTEHGNIKRDAKEWADSFALNIVINAGMYDLAHQLLSKGYLKNKTHTNQPNLQANYNAMIAFERKKPSLPNFTIYDLKCESWESIKANYSCYAQGLRMLDCDGNPMSWNKRKQSCSMLVTALDSENNVYFIFCRSPYSHNEMIAFMQQFSFKLTNAIYMEGGPQTSLYIQSDNFKLEKIGSYVSNTWANDDNDHFWKLPNVIGIRFKD